jgi:hypothetical protein
MRIGSQAAGISWDVTFKCVSLSVAGSICDPQINIPLANSWTIRNKPQAHDSDNQKVSKPSPTAAIVRGSARENNCAFQEPKDIRRAGSKDKTTISLRKNNPNAVPTSKANCKSPCGRYQKKPASKHSKNASSVICHTGQFIGALRANMTL